MSNYIKRCREDAGLTQEQFAEKMQVSVMSVHNWEKGKTKLDPYRFDEVSRILNVSVETLIAELLREENKKRMNNWPGFLFDDQTNEIVDGLHLNLAQQDLFGIMCIYCDDLDRIPDYAFLKEFDERIKKVPYSFIEKTGSIRFINLSDGLKNVMRYVKPGFMMKILRQNPEAEFDVMRLSKEQIMDFIDMESINPEDHGLDDNFTDPLEFGIRMNKARKILPVLEKTGPVYLDEAWVSAPVKDNYPLDLINALIEELGLDKTKWEKGQYGKKGFFHLAMSGIGTVTDIKNSAKKGKPEHWVWSINDRGKELLKWLNE